MRLFLWKLGENTTRPPVGVHNGLLDKNISTKSGQQNCPDNVVNASGSKEAQSHHTMKVVREFLVHILVRGWRNIRCNGKVEIGQHEECGHWYGGTDSRCPIWEVLLLGEIDVYQTGGHEEVDNCKGVGNQAVKYGQLDSSRERGNHT